MAPNPVITAGRRSNRQPQPGTERRKESGVSVAVSLTIIVALLAGAPAWTWYFTISGAGLECLLLIFGSLTDSRIFPNLDVLILLLAICIAFTFSSTAFFLRATFTAICYIAILSTCVYQFSAASNLARTGLRKLVRSMLCFKDKIGFFEVPALVIDTEVDGLFVVRAVTFSLSDLTIEAHGLELAVTLNRETELALCVDRVVIQLFRQINITDVYSNLKVGESNTAYRKPESTGENSEDAVDLPRDESIAEQDYYKALQEIETTSPIHTARKELEQSSSTGSLPDENKMRQTICAKLRSVPSVSHMPLRSVKVSFLQTIFPRVRRFLHRLPLLLRLLLNPLSYFHPIKVSSFNIAGPGNQLEELLQKHVLQDTTSSTADNEQLNQEVSSWLASADFCLEITNLAALCHVPFSAFSEITIYLRSSQLGVYRTLVDSNTTNLVTQVGGADATLVIPAFLLPHHEHCLPAAHKEQDEISSESKMEPSSNMQVIVDHPETDETELLISVHASLPTYFDQSLLDICATLAKATELIDLENLFEQESSNEALHDENSNASPGTANLESSEDQPDTKSASATQTSEPNDTEPDSNKLSSRVRQYVKVGIKKGIKANAVGDKLNDRWITRTVGKIAARLEHAQGDFGYTTKLRVALQPYRLGAETPSKILP